MRLIDSYLPTPPIFSLKSPTPHSPSVSFRFPTFSSTGRRFSLGVSCAKMSCQPQNTPPPTLKPITISYSELQDKDADLSVKIEEGFGPSGLGIISVSDVLINSFFSDMQRFIDIWSLSRVPGFPTLRQNLLHLSPILAGSPEEVKKELEDPGSRYSFGWSHGKEKLESGKLDVLKGSFFANPILDMPTTDASLIQRYPSYCRPNIWPSNDLPELEAAFKSLGKLLLDVGLMLAYHCDRYVNKGAPLSNSKGLVQILMHSRCHKGRLLYYFPAQHSDCGSQDAGIMSSWCGWHTDHGSLTGLTCGMFTRDSEEIECPDSAAGLYIKTQSDQIVKVVFGQEEIGYQIGETAEILSEGRLCATPHGVRAPKGEKAVGVARSTFALFMQPDWDEKLNFPTELPRHQELIPPNGTLTFGEYSEMLLNKYYHRLQ